MGHANSAELVPRRFQSALGVLAFISGHLAVPVVMEIDIGTGDGVTRSVATVVSADSPHTRLELLRPALWIVSPAQDTLGDCAVHSGHLIASPSSATGQRECLLVGLPRTSLIPVAVDHDLGPLHGGSLLAASRHPRPARKCVPFRLNATLRSAARLIIASPEHATSDTPRQTAHVRFIASS